MNEKVNAYLALIQHIFEVTGDTLGGMPGDPEKAFGWVARIGTGVMMAANLGVLNLNEVESRILLTQLCEKNALHLAKLADSKEGKTLQAVAQDANSIVRRFVLKERPTRGVQIDQLASQLVEATWKAGSKDEKLRYINDVIMGMKPQFS